MPTYQAIAALTQNRCIGDKGKLPWHLPKEYAWFKHKTMGGTLIMGSKTYASIGKPLPGRETVVLSRNPGPPCVTTCADIASLEEKLRGLPKPYWICGGSDIYRQFLRLCGVLYLTRIHRVISGDSFFPPFEDKFELEQTIYTSDDFTVERWRRLYHSDPPLLEQEPWPFPEG
ncbi:MAG TPA: dihydrofolate reductase [Candidatus Methylacidiphilales bacterium]|jgi:dihydrofolate reductase|nr:dihydrofolate reductase [Candidatus Methylacidiphilales bacterium]